MFMLITIVGGAISMNPKVLVPTILFVAIVALRTEGGDRLNPKFVSPLSQPMSVMSLLRSMIHSNILEITTNTITSI